MTEVTDTDSVEVTELEAADARRQRRFELPTLPLAAVEL